MQPHEYQPGDLVSIPQACALAGVSRRTIYNWIKRGKVEYVLTAGGGVRIVKASLFRSSIDRD